MKKSLGGDRLGSGAKMDVEMHGYNRSTHDLSNIFRTTMSPGTLVPFLNKIALPGDTFDINLDADVKTHPTVGPLFGSFKLQLDVFSVPIRLFHKTLHNNRLGVGLDMSQIKLPLMAIVANEIDPESTVPPEYQQINQSSLLAYLGLRGVAGDFGGLEHIKVWKNALPLLSYWSIYKNYYANKQEGVGYVIHCQPGSISNASLFDGATEYEQYPTPDPILVTANMVLKVYGEGITEENLYWHMAVLGHNFKVKDSASTLTINEDGTYAEATGWHQVGIFTSYTMDGVFLDPAEEFNATVPRLQEFELEEIDNMQDQILENDALTAMTIDPAKEQVPYTYMLQETVAGNYKMCAMYPQEGLAVKTYQSDIFNNWLSTESIDGANGIAAVTAVSTAGDSFTIDALNLAKKVYDMLNRIAVSGGSYQDWIGAVYDHMGAWRAESPVYCGGLSKEIVFQEVVSTAEATADNPLGSLAGKGVLAQKHKGGSMTIKVDEPSYIMGIVSITPRIDYSQGNNWDMDLTSLNDLHKPALDGIGFQDLITEQMAFWDTSIVSTNLTKHSAGKQPAWINYMTEYNRTYGNFADPRNEMFMTLNRRYEMDIASLRIKDLTTYIDPAKFNYAFAQTDLSAMNFWVQIRNDVTVRRKISAKIIPNL